jgi:hypothetical protein
MTGQFEEIERLFDQLLTTSQPILSETELQEVRHFIDMGEYGLALETLVDIFVEEKRGPGADVTSRIEELAQKMSIDATALMQRLRI